MSQSRWRLLWIAALLAAAAGLVVVIAGERRAVGAGEAVAVDPARQAADTAELRTDLSAQAELRIPPDAKLISAFEQGGMFGYAKRYWFKYSQRPAAVTEGALCAELGLPRLETIDRANFGDAEISRHFGPGSGDSMICGYTVADPSHPDIRRDVRAGRRYLFIFLGRN